MTQFPKDKKFQKILEQAKFSNSFSPLLANAVEMEKVRALVQPSLKFVKAMETFNSHRLIMAQMAQASEPHQKILKDFAESQKALQLLFRPFDELDFSNFHKTMGFVEHAKLYQIAMPNSEELIKTARAFRTPWVSIDNSLLSTKAIADLSSIGKAISVTQPFDPKLVLGLRDSLGDWRTPLKFDLSQVLDLNTRTRLYEAKGFDKTLTSFPPDAFNEAIVLTGVKPSSQEISRIEIKASGVRLPPEENEEAYRLIYSLEARIRLFVIHHMEQQFGIDWLELQVDFETLKVWKDKKQKALEKGEPDRHLIEYADFTDYNRILTRKDNWNKVFKRFFKRKESLQESLYRLYPVRNCTMHSRIVTADDCLILYVEFRRLMKAIEVPY